MSHVITPIKPDVDLKAPRRRTPLLMVAAAIAVAAATGGAVQLFDTEQVSSGANAAEPAAVVIARPVQRDFETLTDYMNANQIDRAAAGLVGSGSQLNSLSDYMNAGRMDDAVANLTGGTGETP